MTKTTPKPKHGNAMLLAAKTDESPTTALARHGLRPSVHAAFTVKAYCKKYGEGFEVGELVKALSDQIADARKGDLHRAEGMLVAQAHTLDAIFNELAQRAAQNMGQYLNATESYLRLALKAQSQCRTTLETLAAIKNPQPVAFVRQANISAGPQQINNAATPLNDPHAREIESKPSELSGGGNELRKNTRTSAYAGRSDPEMEAVGTINRTDNA